MKIAVLLTCFNRKNKTIKCLEHVDKAFLFAKGKIDVAIYLTDDGCTDGTANVVKENFSSIKILEGTGNLFWAKGMNLSWSEALKDEHDGYLLLNDDTYIKENTFLNIYENIRKGSEIYKEPCVLVGTTIDERSKKVTYGGSKITNRFLYKYYRLVPNGQLQECDLGNANIMYVPQEAVDTVGILSKGYAHGVADYDYTLKCRKNKIPVLVLPEINGFCAYDHKKLYHDFTSKTIKERLEYLNNPMGIDFKSRLLFMSKFFPLRYPFFYMLGWFKVIFPRTYLKYFYHSR